MLREKSIEFELIQEQFWNRRTEFLKLNPAGVTPVIVTADQKVFSGNTSIVEYLDEKYQLGQSIYGNQEQRAEIRRIEEWFDVKFYYEVTRYIFQEKILKSIIKKDYPNSQAIQAAKRNLATHMAYIEFLTRDSRYLCGDLPTRADFAAAAQLSVLDFTGDINWSSFKNAKEWYCLIKSRPSFKPILNDAVPGMQPPSHYTQLDY